MLVHAWVQPEHAHQAERARIRAALAQGLPLLNVARCQMDGTLECTGS
jgi:hypothetical protein